MLVSGFKYPESMIDHCGSKKNRKIVVIKKWFEEVEGNELEVVIKN